jgi:N6-L-threonylcarbamoyladenine synthase
VAPPSLVLGIESSCDEMAAAVLRDGREVLASCVRGQDRTHAPYGGVVPELASRDHLRAVAPVVEAALAEAGVEPAALGAVAATAGPGLVGSLLVGLSYGKGLAFRLGVPFVGVHHLEGHLISAELADERLVPPYVGLVVSGGHTALYRIESEAFAPVLLGETRDDAVGEAFDKVAKLLGLPYPGGPALSRCAEGGDPGAIDFPRPLAGTPGYDFSYSGLKTAVRLEVERRAPLSDRERADLAASFEAAATDVLVARARRALRDEGIGRLAVVGGVAANRRLREAMGAAARSDGFLAVFPPPAFCTDNAVMVAAAGARLLARSGPDALDLEAYSRRPLGEHGAGKGTGTP